MLILGSLYILCWVSLIAGVGYRCNIPVILMGETGCGKTRLLRYLCELQAKNYDTKNLLTMKVCLLSVTDFFNVSDVISNVRD